MSRNLIFSHGEYYHIYNRGAHKEPIFLDQADYYRFLVILYLKNNLETITLADMKDHNDVYEGFFDISRGDTLVDIGAYCLMPNHFHLLVRAKSDEGISSFMHKLSTAYSMYYNLKYQHSGSVFQGRFKAKFVANDMYLKELFAYIHLNPVELYQSDWKEDGIKDLTRASNFLFNHEYSSYQDYIGKVRPQGVILNRSAFPVYFQSIEDFGQFINLRLSLK